MKSSKHFSIWSNEEVKQWLSSINLKRYIESFSINNVHGYDLCYLTSEDFKTLGIVNIHDKNTLLKGIRLKTLEQLQIQVKYESKEALIQLDFDSSFTVYNFTSFLNELFNIQSPITIATESNEILSPNIKLVELILLNPVKYKRIKILKDLNEAFGISVSSSQYQNQGCNNHDNDKTDEPYQRGVDYDEESHKTNNHITYIKDNNRERVINDEVSDYDSEENYEMKQYNGRQVIPISEQDEETDRNQITNRQFSDDSTIIDCKMNHYKDKKDYWNNNSHTPNVVNYTNNKHSQSLANTNEHLGHGISIIENKKYNSINYDNKQSNQGFNYDYKQPGHSTNQYASCSNNIITQELKRGMGYNKSINNII